MPKYIATCGGASRPIAVEPAGPHRYRVTVDGHTHEVDAHFFAGGNWSLLIDQQSYDVELEVAGPHEGEGRYNALIRGQIFPLEVEDERRRRMALTSKKLKVEGPQTLLAPMPGKVVKVLVKVGDTVEEGQPIVIMEAMKMENELRAASKGQVTKVMAVEGQNVESQAALVAFS